MIIQYAPFLPNLKIILFAKSKSITTGLRNITLGYLITILFSYTSKSKEYRRKKKATNIINKIITPESSIVLNAHLY